MKPKEVSKLEPFMPTHPGEIIKNEIEYRGISQRMLAAEIGVSYTQLPFGATILTVLKAPPYM